MAAVLLAFLFKTQCKNRAATPKKQTPPAPLFWQPFSLDLFARALGPPTSVPSFWLTEGRILDRDFILTVVQSNGEARGLGGLHGTPLEGSESESGIHHRRLEGM